MSNSLRPMDCSPPGSSLHGILQARILEWVAISFSRGSSQSKGKPASPALQADSLPLHHRGCPWSHSRFKPSLFESRAHSVWLYCPRGQGLHFLFLLNPLWCPALCSACNSFQINICRADEKCGKDRRNAERERVKCSVPGHQQRQQESQALSTNLKAHKGLFQVGNKDVCQNAFRRGVERLMGACQASQRLRFAS